MFRIVPSWYWCMIMVVVVIMSMDLGQAFVVRSSHSSMSKSRPINKRRMTHTDDDPTPLAFGGVPDSLSSSSSSTDTTTTTTNTPSSSITKDLPLVQLALAGSLTTFVSDMIMHPIDCIKTLQQSNVALQLGLDTNFVKAATYLYTSYDDGILAFYHGFLTYAMSDAMGGALKFAVWELWKQQKPQQTSSNNNDHETTATLPQQIFTALYLLVGAALAFVASSVVIVPGELVKQQLQMNKYDGLVNALVGIYNSNNGGLLAFFAGYEGVLYRDIPYTMLELGLYELFKSIVVQVRYNDTKDDEHGPPQTLQAWEEVAAAAVTGGLTAFCTTPFDVIKTKLMVDSEYANYSFWQCLVETVDAHGWPSVFSGVIARIAWILPFTAIYLPTYDALKRVLLLRHIAYVEDQQQEAIKTR